MPLSVWGMRPAAGWCDGLAFVSHDTTCTPIYFNTFTRLSSSVPFAFDMYKRLLQLRLFFDGCGAFLIKATMLLPLGFRTRANYSSFRYKSYCYAVEQSVGKNWSIFFFGEKGSMAIPSSIKSYLRNAGQFID